MRPAVVLLLCAVICPDVHGRKVMDMGRIDFTDNGALARRRPILIAHRGGVVTKDSPEGSLSAIRKAADQGYDMVELDIRMTVDEEPILFHDRSLDRSTGREGAIEDLALAQAASIPFLGTEETIPSLDEALGLCRDLLLGVMLDIKTDGSERFFERMKDLLEKNGFDRTNTVAISSRPAVRSNLEGRVRLRFLHEDLAGWEEKLPEKISGDFWFGQPSELPSEVVSRLQSGGLLVLTAINAFRYLPSGDTGAERKDADRLLEAGVDGFQIDSRYQHFFGLPELPLD